MAWNFVLVNGDQSHLLKNFYLVVLPNQAITSETPKCLLSFTTHQLVGVAEQASVCAEVSVAGWDRCMGIWENRTGQDRPDLQTLCVCGQNMKRSSCFFSAFPCHSPRCAPLCSLMPSPARHEENRFQMGWFCPHGENVVVRFDCSVGPVQTCIIR